MNHNIFNTNNIDTLSLAEKVLEYIYINGITYDNFDSHQKEIFKFFNTTKDFNDFKCFYINNFSTLNAGTTMKPVEAVGCFVHPRFNQVQPHTHDFFEFKYVLKGNATVFFNDQALTMKKSDFCIISPNTMHQTFIFDSETIMINFTIRRESITHSFCRIFLERNFISDFLMIENIENRNSTNFLYIKTNEDVHIENLAFLTYKNCSQRNSSNYSPLITESGIELILLKLATNYSTTQLPYEKIYSKNRKIYNILTFIRKNLSEITFKELSKEFNFSEAYLSRFIKKQTGQTFSEILKTYRLYEAAELLRNSKLSIMQIMQKIGYSGKTYFYDIFYEKHGMTPGVYAEKFGIK